MLVATASYGTPRNAIINGEKWNIVEQIVIWHNGISNYNGWTDCNHHTITVAKFVSRSYKSIIIVHEVEHAMTCEDGEVHNEKFNNDPSGVHMGIYWSSEQWQSFIVNNPELIKWIGESEKD